MKISFGFYLLLLVNIVHGQNRVNIPICDFVQTEKEFRLLVPLTVNKNGNFIINDSNINTESEFDKKISSQIIYQVFNKSLGYSTIKFEIQIDSSCKIEKIDSIFKFLAGRSFNKLFLVAKTKASSRIDGILSTGFNYEIELNEIQNNLTSKIRNQNGIPPPSPPPSIGWNMPFKYSVPSTFTINNYKNYDGIVEVYKVKKLPNSEGYSINNMTHNRTDFKLAIRKLIKNNLCAFELILDRSATYFNFVELISPIKNEIEDMRNKYSNNKYSQNYYNLGYSDKINVVDAYPDLIKLLIEE